ETAVDVTWWPCERHDRRDFVPIGRPIANCRTYILDPKGEPVPVGVAGELHIAGVCVGAGYSGKPELTAEGFVPDLFAPDKSAKMYRSGDLCRYLEDGTIEYLGRMDHQVKLRGFRIELGEIESTLRRHPAVQEAVVAVAGSSSDDRRLVAYWS